MMNEKTNTLKHWGIHEKLFNHICQRTLNRRSLGITRQDIEKGDFTFDYQGEGSEDFEFIKYRKNHKGKSEVVRVPIYNEHVTSRGGFIDWVNFTFSHGQKDSETAILLLSAALNTVLGYGVTAKRERGLNLYEESYILGDYWGFVCIGGQNNTVMVTINGEGCTAARKGWEKRLYNLANKLSPYQFRITRVDVAHDLFGGEYTVDNAVKDYDDGFFGAGGRTPKIQQYGNWRIPDDTNGRTVYLGNRKSGKYCRIYEKGKQLGEKYSPWVRIECEWRNKNREIPYDILVKPGCYLAGAYPAFFWLNKTQSRIKTKVRREKIILAKAIEIGKQQIGGLILFLTMMGESPESIVEKLIGNKFSKRFLSPDWEHSDKLICAT